MNLHPRTSLAAVLLGGLALVGAAAPAPNAMYLRVPATRAAAAVTLFSYDAVATVPQASNVPQALLPRDYVEATMDVPASAAGPFASGNRVRSYPLWTVVETDASGRVVQRTIFHAVTIDSIRPASSADGSATQRVRFTAASVVVQMPGNEVATAK